MGEIEFNDLKNKHSLNREDLIEYAVSLENQRILRHTHANDFKTNIAKIFGQENRKEENKQNDKEFRGEPKVR